MRGNPFEYRLAHIKRSQPITLTWDEAQRLGENLEKLRQATAGAYAISKVLDFITDLRGQSIEDDELYRFAHDGFIHGGLVDGLAALSFQAIEQTEYATAGICQALNRINEEGKPCK